MANKGNENFLNMLRDRGPYNYCNAQYSEHSHRTGYKDVAPLTFTLPRHTEYRALILDCLQQERSQVFLIHGQAGDGKSHFLYEVCTDADLFNLSAKTMEMVLDGICSRLYVDDEGNASAHKTSSKNSHSCCIVELPPVPGKRKSVRLLLVNDLTTAKAEDKEAIISFMEQCNARCMGNEGTVCTGAVSEGKDDGVCAGPDDSFCAGPDDAGSEGQGTAVAGGPEGAVTMENDGGQSDSSPVCIALIAGNNGMILNMLNQYAQLSKCSDEAVRESMSRIAGDIEKHLISRSAFSSSFLQLLSMSDCLDRKALEIIMHSILDHDRWEKCLECDAQSKCPVYTNRCMLRLEHAVRKFGDIIEILHDNGEKITIRNIIMVMANAIIGHGKDGQSQKEKAFSYTCRKAYNDAQKLPLPARRTSPFDNLTGHNLPARQTEEKKANFKNFLTDNSRFPVYAQLNTLEAGYHTCFHVDHFIREGNIDGSPFQEVHKKLISDHDVADIFSTLEQKVNSVRSSISISDIKSVDRSSSSESIQQNMQSLRRMLFFIMPDGEDAVFNSWSMSSMSSGGSYIKLKKALHEHFDLNEAGVDRCADILINGLNRAFTSLPVMDSNNTVYITTNNITDPATFCVLPDYAVCQLRFDKGPKEFNNVIKLVHSGLIGDSRALPALVYYRGQTPRWRSKSPDCQLDASQLSAFNSHEFLPQHLTQAIGRYNNYFEKKLSVSPLEATLSDRINVWWMRLENHYRNEELADDEIADYKELSRIITSSVKTSSSPSGAGLITIPEPDNASGMVPNPEAYMILTPRIFNYLMEMGSGYSPASLSQELGFEINCFKDRIYNVIRAERSSSRGDDQAGSSKGLRLNNLKFCDVDVNGHICAN